ncbi:Sigma-adaptin 3A [Tulasnella sp. 403]|nr:Sigma-adaptin 3A [Tulasnella sp. 403]
MIFNTAGVPRLTKFYTPVSHSLRTSLPKTIFKLVSTRPSGLCNFLDAPELQLNWAKNGVEGDETRVVYRCYATLYFVFVVDGGESELGILDLIQVFVESLDRAFENVCELDLVFHFDEVHYILSEVIQGGLVLETNVEEIAVAVKEASRARKTSYAAAHPLSLGVGGLQNKPRLQNHNHSPPQPPPLDMSSNTFDLLLADLVSAPAKKELSSNPLDWLLFDSDVAAPHPDAFESELDTLAALGGLDTDLALQYTTLDSFNPANLSLFSQYRAPNTYSAYSGYGGAPSTITVSSETLSTYGSVYEPFEKIAEQPTAVGSGPQQPTSLSSIFPIDLNFSTFNLTAPAAASPDLNMLPRLSLDTQDASNDSKAPRSHGTSSAYDSASPSGDSLYYPANYLGTGPSHPSLASISAPAPTSVQPKAEPAGNADLDPRKKYQCPSCPRAFARAFNLKTHMATHDPNRVKQFVCRHSGCGRSFSRKHDLGRHLVSIHQDTNGVGSQNATSPTANTSRVSPKSRVSPSSVGVGGGDKERIWCDTCGRGWLAGSRDACDCDNSQPE